MKLIAKSTQNYKKNLKRFQKKGILWQNKIIDTNQKSAKYKKSTKIFSNFMQKYPKIAPNLTRFRKFKPPNTKVWRKNYYKPKKWRQNTNKSPRKPLQKN